MVYFTPEEIQVIKDACCFMTEADIAAISEDDESWGAEYASAKTLFALMGEDFPGVNQFCSIETEDDAIYNYKLPSDDPESDDTLWNKLFHNWGEGKETWLNLLEQAPSVNIDNKPLEGVYGGTMWGQSFQGAPTVLFVADDSGMERIYFNKRDFDKLFPTK